ncbi:hypothetical protein PPYR_04271, partial [Photinus pyralis]
MKLTDIQDLGTSLFVRVPNTKTNRTFTVTDHFYNICKKYISNRNNVSQNLVFMQERHGKLKNQRVGINSFTKMGKDIASFLKLSN